MLSAVGEVTVERQYESCRRCKHHHFAFDEQIGWRHGQSTKVRNWIALCAQAESFDGGRALLAELTGVEVAHRTMETVSQGLGAVLRQAENTAVFHEPEPTYPSGQGVPDTLCIVVDAVKAPCLPDWRDVKVATIFEWRPGRGEREGQRLNVEYVFGIEHWETFGRRVEIAARRRGSHAGAHVVVAGDGADWIWDLAQRHFPGATCIVDWFHAVEHLWSVARAMFGDSELAQAWVRRRKAELWEGQVSAVCAAMGYARSGVQRRSHHDNRRGTLKLIDDTRRYLLVRRERMQYHLYRQQGLFIGTGTVEAACKTLVSQRAKQSGMRWKEPGLIDILALRALRLSHQWLRIHQAALAA